jgi:hypothetical protein
LELVALLLQSVLKAQLSDHSYHLVALLLCLGGSFCGGGSEDDDDGDEKLMIMLMISVMVMMMMYTVHTVLEYIQYLLQLDTAAGHALLGNTGMHPDSSAKEIDGV